MSVGWTIIPNDWVQLERVINELGSRILDEDNSLSDYLQESDMVGPDILEPNTEVWVIVGPLISSLDGTTPVQSLVLGDITAAIYKGVTRSVLTLTAANFVEMPDGYVKIKLTASDTNTQGRLTLTLRDDDVFLGKSREFWVK